MASLAKASAPTAELAIRHALDALRRMSERALALGLPESAIAAAIGAAAEALLDAAVDDLDTTGDRAAFELSRWCLDIEALTTRLRANR